MILAFCSSPYFGPSDFNRRIDKNRVYILVEWSEISTCGTMNNQFGPLNWAEVMSLHLNAFEAKIYAFGVIFTCFCCFDNIAELQGWISAQQ